MLLVLQSAGCMVCSPTKQSVQLDGVAVNDAKQSDKDIVFLALLLSCSLNYGPRMHLLKKARIKQTGFH